MKIRSFLKLVFNRTHPGIQKYLAAIYYRIPGKEQRGISYEDDIFEHRFKDVYFFAPTARLEGPQEMSDLTFDIFCWRYRPKTRDIVIDVGAGIGSEALTFSRLVGEEGLVICVEPHPLISRCLARTIDKNGLSNTRVEQVALAETVGVIQMGNSINAWDGNSIISHGDEIVDVEGISFDDLLERNSIQGLPIDFVKMNIEGAEWPVLQGMAGSLERIQNLAISCHDFKGQRLGNSEFRTYMYVLEFLKDHGFRVVTRADPRSYVADVVYASRA
jgi:FkbM family methyltransferase